MKSRSPALLLGGGGLAWLLGQSVLPDMGPTTADRYDAVAGSRVPEAWSAGLLVVAGCLLVLGALAVSRDRGSVRGRGSGLVTTGSSLLALGGVWLVAGRAAFNMVFLRVTDDAVPRDVAIAVLDNGGGPEFVPLVLTLPCLLVGPVLLALGLRSAGRTGWVPLVAWVTGIGVFLASEFTVKAGEVAGMTLAATGLVLIGWAATRGSPADGAARDDGGPAAKTVDRPDRGVPRVRGSGGR